MPQSAEFGQAVYGWGGTETVDDPAARGQDRTVKTFPQSGRRA